MQDGEKQDALADFNLAIEEDPENSDIYHHRGQVCYAISCILKCQSLKLLTISLAYRFV